MKKEYLMATKVYTIWVACILLYPSTVRRNYVVDAHYRNAVGYKTLAQVKELEHSNSDCLE